MERKVSNAQLVQLLKEPVAFNSWEPNKEPKKIFGITVKQEPKSFVREEHRHWREFGCYHLEATPELHVVESLTMLKLIPIEETKKRKSRTYNDLVASLPRPSSSSKDDLEPKALLYFVNEGDEPKRIIIKLTTYKDFNLFRGKAVLHIGDEAVELLRLNEEKITDEKHEFCFYEVTQNDFVNFFNGSKNFIELEGNGNWRVLVKMLQHVEEKKIQDELELKLFHEERKAKEAKEKNKSYRKKSTSELKKEVIDEMNDRYERRFEKGFWTDSNGKTDFVERMWYYHWVFSEGPFNCEDEEHRNLAFGKFTVYHKRWHVAYDLNFNTNHWPEEMQNYMQALERFEATAAKFKKWKESVIRFFKNPFGKAWRN